jgi:hypothetical protein
MRVYNLLSRFRFHLSHLLLACLPVTCGFADETVTTVVDGVAVVTTVLHLHPAPASIPSQEIALFPRESDRIDGNSALYYLRAMGFIEQEYARRLVNQMRDQYAEKAKAAGKQSYELGPDAWISASPDEIPLQEAKQYLSYLSFQPRDIEAATLRRQFSMDRDERNAKSPITILLPEIQYMRQLARTQQVRIRVALAEKRIEDALHILRQQFALANHLEQEPFLVSNLVGLAVAGMGMGDLAMVVGQPDCPNLYWSIGELPSPIVSFKRSFEFETDLLFLEFKEFNSIGDRPSNLSWASTIESIFGKIDSIENNPWYRLTMDMGAGADANPLQRAIATAAAYPACYQFLVKHAGMKTSSIDMLDHTQVVLLAVRRAYEIERSEARRWFFVDDANVSKRSEEAQQDSDTRSETLGFANQITQLLLPAFQPARVAQIRSNQNKRLLQTVESIRDHVSRHQSLPSTLNELHLPAPNDPVTGLPFGYQRNGDHAVLKGEKTSIVPVFELHYATQSKPN